MNTSFEYFMAVVEEESISRAAQKLFLSPQNLNNHIHRLEKAYGTLFIRKPQFQLTPVGQMLYQTLQQIAVQDSGPRGMDSNAQISISVHLILADSSIQIAL